MRLTITCPACGATLKQRDGANRPRKARCPRCSSTIDLGEVAEESVKPTSRREQSGRNWAHVLSNKRSLIIGALSVALIAAWMMSGSRQASVQSQPPAEESAGSQSVRQTDATSLVGVAGQGFPDAATGRREVGVPGNPAASSLGERYALLIGVRKYTGNSGLNALKFAEADVDSLADVLTSAGYRPENVMVMTHKRGAEDIRNLPTRENILRELRAMLTHRDPGDTVLVALAGHGVQYRGEEDSYFCPLDAQVDEKLTLIALGEVYKQLEQSSAGLKLLFCDACRNDPFSSNSRRATVRLESVSRPPILRPPGGMAAFFSCSEGECAFEHPEIGHGVFFHYLIQGLQGAADLDNDLSVDVSELEGFTKKRVADFVRGKFDAARQMPHVVSNIRGIATLVKATGGAFPAIAATPEKTVPSGQKEASIPALADGLAERLASTEQNLRTIGEAFKKFHDVYGCLPPATVLGSDGKAWHSWRVLILPFLGEDGEFISLYHRYDFKYPWDAPNNRAVLGLVPAPYQCALYGEEYRLGEARLYTHFAVAAGLAESGASAFPQAVRGVLRFGYDGQVYDPAQKTIVTPQMIADSPDEWIVYGEPGNPLATLRERARTVAAGLRKQKGAVRFSDFHDSLGNTLLVGTVSPSLQIPWTKPEDVGRWTRSGTTLTVLSDSKILAERERKSQFQAFSAPYRVGDGYAGLFLSADRKTHIIRDTVKSIVVSCLFTPAGLEAFSWSTDVPTLPRPK